MNNRKGVLPLIMCLLIPVVVGGVSSLLTSDAMSYFASVNKPPLAPPGWLFPIVWTILYLLMGFASYMLYISDSDMGTNGLIIYGIQLIFNFCWSILFFRFEWYWIAAIWLLIMWALIICLIGISKKVSTVATLCLIPYLLWTTFAAYLNIGIAWLN